MEDENRRELIANVKSNFDQLYENCVKLKNTINDFNVMINGGKSSEIKFDKLVELKNALDELNNYRSGDTTSQDLVGSEEGESSAKSCTQKSQLNQDASSEVSNGSKCTTRRKHKGPVTKKIACKQCGEDVSGYMMTRHMKLKHGVTGKLITCSVCNTEFSEFYFDHHMENVHSN